MNDTRVKLLRAAVERFAESLDATIRVDRWEHSESVPEPLLQSARELSARHDAANRLVAGPITSSRADAATVSALRSAVARLTLAYEAYMLSAERQSRRSASMVLEDEMGSIRAETSAW